MKIDIIGGISLPKKITISSDRFTSSARCKYNKTTNEASITCEVKETSKLVQALRQKYNWPIPRLLFLAIFLWVNSKTLGKLLISLVVLSNVSSCILSTQVSSGNPPQTLGWMSHSILFIFIIGVAWVAKTYIAKWHGAEHMAIACYERHEAYDVMSIKAESLIHKGCGGRFIFPIWLSQIICTALIQLEMVNLNISLMMLIAFEIILWIDFFIGFDKIYGFSHASEWLQKYITTKKPGQVELATAALAMERLVVAHQKTNRNHS